MGNRNNFRAACFLRSCLLLTIALVPVCSAGDISGVPPGKGRAETKPPLTSELLEYDSQSVPVPNVTVGQDAESFTFSFYTNVLDIG